MARHEHRLEALVGVSREDIGHAFEPGRGLRAGRQEHRGRLGLERRMDGGACTTIGNGGSTVMLKARNGCPENEAL